MNRELMILQIYIKTNYSIELLNKMTDAELEQFYRERVDNGQFKK